MTSATWVLKKYWHPRRRRLARLRALYWIVVRRHESEICGKCGGPVRVVYHVPESVWLASGFPHASEGGGVLCIPCLDDEAEHAGLPFLRWTCSAMPSGDLGPLLEFDFAYTTGSGSAA